MTLQGGHSGDHQHQHQPIAAWVGGVAITEAAVRERENTLRSGPFAARLPVRRTPQGRNIVRWIVQLIATEHIIEDEARQRSLRWPPNRPRPQLRIETALELGGVLATVLASRPVAMTVRDAVSGHVQVSRAQLRSYYDRNIDQFKVPASRQLDQIRHGQTRPWSRVVAGELPPAWESAIFNAQLNQLVRVDSDRSFIVREIQRGGVRSFDTVSTEIAEQLREHQQNLHFAAWVQHQQHRQVLLQPGYEHPGDPHQADATHRH